ncbi:MAG: DUF2505 domain-containing protein [Myxococcota bacterium]
MQKLYVESRLPVNPEVAWDIFESDAFRDRLREHTNMESEVLEDRDEGTVNIRKIKYVSGRELPGMVAKALGSKHLSYVQTNHFDTAKSRLDWVVELPMLGDRVTVEGFTLIEPASHGSRRVVDGRIEVKMRLIGGQIEKAVVGEFEKSMRQAVDIALEMMRERGSDA